MILLAKNSEMRKEFLELHIKKLLANKNILLNFSTNLFHCTLRTRTAMWYD